MKRAIIMFGAAILYILGISVAIAAPIPATQVAAKVDPRIELISIIFRLAGNKEYNLDIIPSYVRDVTKHFGPFKDHPAIKFAAELAKTKDIGYDAPISMAIRLSDSMTPRRDLRFPGSLVSFDNRWTPADAEKFVALAGKFAKDTSFNNFFAEQRPLYDTAERRLQRLLDNDVRLGWFPEFFGGQAAINFHAIPGMLTGDNSYGPSITTIDGQKHIYAITAIYADKNSKPNFSKGMRQIIAHEFIHSYSNPLVDKFEVELEAPAKKLFGLTSKLMEQQNYGNWKTLMYESLNRACGIHYILATQGPEAAKALTEKERNRGFYWVPGLADLLAKYDTRPRKYKDLTEFFPEIITYFNDYSGKAEAEIKSINDKKLAEKEARNREMQRWQDKGPKVVRVFPFNGKKDIPPGKTTITVTFDRPMGSGYSVVTIGPGKSPIGTGNTGFNQAKTIFTMPTELEPATDYSFGLNTAEYASFKSEDGIPLYPVEVHFRTADTDKAADTKRK